MLTMNAYEGGNYGVKCTAVCMLWCSDAGKLLA